jgi:hypothetical protein
MTDRNIPFNGAHLVEDPLPNGDALPEFTPDERQYLEIARDHLRDAGFYAYVMVDDMQRWCAAADDEAGRIDIRLDDRWYTIEVCASSPGLYMEEESEWRRQALERLARRVVPNIARGMLEPNQSARWSDDDHGVTVCVSYDAGIDRPEEIPAVARRAFLELDDLLTRVEAQLRT